MHKKTGWLIPQDCPASSQVHPFSAHPAIALGPDPASAAKITKSILAAQSSTTRLQRLGPLPHDGAGLLAMTPTTADIRNSGMCA